MERHGTRALGTRPGEQSSAPSAKLRALRVDLLGSSLRARATERDGPSCCQSAIPANIAAVHRENPANRVAVCARITELGDRTGPSPPGPTKLGGTMIEALSRNWGWVALRGVVAILFGILTLNRPGISLASLVLLFGAYSLVDGSFMVVSAIANRKGAPRWVTMLFGGVLGIITGIVTFMWPGITAMALLAIIAAWALLTGITEIVVAIRLRKEISGEWALILAGVLAVAFGLFLIMRPLAGALAALFVIGIYAVVSGILHVVLGFRLRSWNHLAHAAH